MLSKTNFSTILIIDQQQGVSKTLNIKTKHILKWKYYALAIALLIISLTYVTFALYQQLREKEKEQHGLTLKINDLQNRLPQPGDTTIAKDYVQQIDVKLKKISEYLKKRGVQGFTTEAVGGNSTEADNISLEEHFTFYEDYLEKIFAGLIYTPTGFPSKPHITSYFGYRKDPFHPSRADIHTGLDFRGNKGDLVRSTAAGQVIFAGWASGYGKCVKIAHKNGYQTLYGHLSKIGVRKGEQVKVSQLIGLIGSTGNSTGNHLHYEVRKFGKPVNPINSLHLN